MKAKKVDKPHAVIIPYPAQGHVNPLMQLAKLLHSRGFHITFVNTEYNHRRLTRAKGPESMNGLPDFQFETIPDGLPPPDRDDVTQPTSQVCDSTRKHSLVPFRELLIKLNLTPQVPPVTCVISDAVMSFTMKVAKELNIPEAQFWTASACGLMGYYQFAQLVKKGLVPFKDESYLCNGHLDTPLDWIPGMKGIRLKDMPSFCHTTDPNDIMLNFMIEQMHNCSNSSGIIINTFEQLEKEVLDALALLFPKIYTTGPQILISRSISESQMNSIDPSVWQENTECLEWLNKREAGSVVYVNFGSVVFMNDEQMNEFVWGLANCGHNFLWIIRPDIAMGNSATLPQGFVEETRERGMIASWCPQTKVLSHSAVGLFVTHTGWNSLLESVSYGVPVLCWPRKAEQKMNCHQACTVLGNGMQIESEVKREDVVGLVKEMMIGKIGKEKREKALEWKKKAEEATDKGGSSCDALDRLIKEVLLQKH